tara:strand:- start:157 stop:270 length:114 start_codon:yes stop_codon:yes gene_type:complete
MEDFHARKGEFKNTVEDFSAMVFFNVFLDIASLTQER